jgi:succinate-semialdehyde dehydrogenase/glutarate-semialdehyde dehydrogenase
MARGQARVPPYGCAPRRTGTVQAEIDAADLREHSMAIATVNPATGETLKTYEPLSDEALEDKIARAATAWTGYRRTSAHQRAAWLRSAADVLDADTDTIAELMTTEMGKTLASAKAEVAKCAKALRWYGEHGPVLLEPQPGDAEAVGATDAYVVYQPIGVVLAIMPWNFPLWQVFRFAAPALMAGNGGLLKHASNVPGCALAIEQIFKDAGFPAGLFRTLLIGSRHVKDIIEHPLVRAVTLTGSTPAGKAVASQAGAVLKKTVLELGGSDAYVVLEDADLEAAVTTCVNSRLINAGQSCIAAKRFVVVAPVLDAFTERFVALMKSKKVGDPLAEGTEVGPQARHDLRDALHTQVLASIDGGAKLLLGGTIPPGEGAYYPPTVLANIKPGMPAYEEELFGPVASIIAARDEADAIRIANDSVFGLGGAVFTKDSARGERVARSLEAGATFVNSLVASDPRLPFGGIKESGYGRELGPYGIKEFVNVKTVVVK